MKEITSWNDLVKWAVNYADENRIYHELRDNGSWFFIGKLFTGTQLLAVSQGKDGRITVSNDREMYSVGINESADFLKDILAKLFGVGVKK